MKFFRILLLFFLILTLSACNGNTLPATPTASKSKTIITYNDITYYFKDTTIYCSSSLSGNNQEYAVCSDSLCAHNLDSCPLFLGMRPYLMAIDPLESTENDDYPIIYVSSMYFSTSDTKNPLRYRIIRYDSKNNKSKVIASEIPNPINCFITYGDHIFYTTNDGDAGYNIYRTDKNSSQIFSLDNSSNTSYTLIDVTSDHVYYNDLSGNIYRSPLSLDSTEFVVSSASLYGSSYIFDDYLYYADNCIVTDVMGDTDVYSCSIFRKNLSDLTKSSDLYLNNILYNGMPYFFIYENYAYYCIGNYNYIGKGFNYDLDNKKIELDVYSDGSNKIYQSNLTLSSEPIVIDLGNECLGTFYHGEGNNIIISTYESEFDLSKEYVFSTKNISYNFTNNSFSPIP